MMPIIEDEATGISLGLGGRLESPSDSFFVNGISVSKIRDHFPIGFQLIEARGRAPIFDTAPSFVGDDLAYVQSVLKLFEPQV